MCTSPIYRYPVDDTVKFLGKRKCLINGAYMLGKDELPWLAMKLNGDLSKLQTIGCGQCLECRMSNSRQKAQRACLEASLYRDNYFVTLTYDDKKVDLSELIYSINPKTLKVGTFINLDNSVVQAFMKRLRSHFLYHCNHEGIRAMYCGEYGPKHGRAHYHLNIFNLPLYDLKFKEMRKAGNVSYCCYTSDVLSDAWQHKGNVEVMVFTPETASYVSRYILKKQTGRSWVEYESLCRDLGVEPMKNEFNQLPMRPGLARAWYEQHKDEVYDIDQVILPNGVVSKPAKYFDNLFDAEEPDLFLKIKEERIRKVDEEKLLRQLRSGKSYETLTNNRRIKNEINVKSYERADL